MIGHICIYIYITQHSNKCLRPRCESNLQVAMGWAPWHRNRLAQSPDLTKAACYVHPKDLRIILRLRTIRMLEVLTISIGLATVNSADRAVLKLSPPISATRCAPCTCTLIASQPAIIVHSLHRCFWIRILWIHVGLHCAWVALLCYDFQVKLIGEGTSGEGPRCACDAICL